MQIPSTLKKIIVFGGLAWLVATVLTGSFFRVHSDKQDKERFIKERARFGLASSDVSRAIAVQAYGDAIATAEREGVLDNSPLARQIVRRTAEPIISAARKLYPQSADWPWDIHVIASKEVNAWCMDGGKIVVYTGLLELIGFSKDKLAAVLAHEVSHALLEHNRASLSRQWSLDSLFWILSKSLKMGSFRTAEAQEGVAHALFRSGERRDETEADLLGLEIMSKAGFDPAKGIGLWQDFADSAGQKSRLALKAERFLSDHPVDEDRLAILGQRVEQARALAAKAPEQKSWLMDRQHLKGEDLKAMEETTRLYGMNDHFVREIVNPLLDAAAKTSELDRNTVVAVMRKALVEQLSHPDSYHAYALALARENAGSFGVLSDMGKHWRTWLRGHTGTSLLAQPELCGKVFQDEEEKAICKKTVKDIRTMTEQEGGRALFSTVLLSSMATLDPRFAKSLDAYVAMIQAQGQDGTPEQPASNNEQ